ncbi:hypothetical protein [Marinobacter sp. OP 3.4]|uniref:hypothetical protein n=1 Tax=Marinobacter sp. OP 3.4 TaxID=3076501 RepID=UPI002E22B431
MLDDLLSKINEVIEQEEEGKGRDKRGSTQIVVGDIVNNRGTVVIGDGNQDIGRRESDQPGNRRDNSSHGRRASDKAIRDEVQELRSQVDHLRKLVLKNPSEVFKDGNPTSNGCLTSDGAKDQNARMSQTDASISHRPSNAPKLPPCLASSHIITFHPTLSRVSHTDWLHTT